jgi:DNA-binding LacI/PurR family transcriptional regulator
VNRDHDVFISDYIDGITEIAIQNDYALQTIKYENTDISSIAKDLENSKIDGAIILGTELSQEDIRKFDIIKFPLVFIDTYYPYLNYDFVDMDNKDAAFLVIKEFKENGHRSIGIVSSMVEVENFRLRLSGFENAMEREGMDKEFINIQVDSRFQIAYRDMITYIDKGGMVPSALFCINDIIAFACLKALKDRSYKIPDDVSIIGFDNLSLGDMADPPLTTIDVEKKRIGNSAAKQLIQRINSPEIFPPVKISIGTKLIRKKSVQNIKTNWE